MLISTARLLIAAIGVSFLLWGTGEVAAEYPPPVGSVSAAVSETAPEPGSAVTVTCTVLDAGGSPVAGQSCTFSIVSQPGGASFDGAQSVVRSTDANGIATAVLNAGMSPGSIVVSVEAEGMVSQVTINTGASPELPPSEGASASSGSTRWWALAGAAAGLVVVLGAAFVIVALRGQRGRA